MAMNVRVRSVQGPGDRDKEYVVLEVTGDCDLGRYLLAASAYTAGDSISDEFRHTYWFPDAPVRAGDLVALYTRAGANAAGASPDGTPVHAFYWGLDEPVWGGPGGCAVLIEAADWQVHRARRLPTRAPAAGPG